MKNYFLAFLFVPFSVFSEWIQPPAETDSGYPVPTPDFMPDLPRAHGAHPGYGIEWWYWVGHLTSSDGREEFGFQSTVFRMEGKAGQMRTGFVPAFGDQQLFMAHAALTDISGGIYTHAERVYREGWQARSSAERLDLQVGGITARMLEESEEVSKVVSLEGGASLELSLKPLKPMVVFGERGLSRKGADPSAVSWYWTYTRLEANGVLIRDGEKTPVTGVAWMDHEISSSQLGSDLEGWDWTAIQLDDGTEVKAYRLRRKDGSADPWSAVYWIDEQGESTGVYAEDFTWETKREWESAKTGNSYPTSVIINARHPQILEQKSYRLEPLLDPQEFIGNRGDNAYWEGACLVYDEEGKVIGRAYLELAGYGGGLGGLLTN